MSTQINRPASHPIETELGTKAERKLLPLQKGDVPDTWADCSKLQRITGFKPSTTVEVGVRNFVKRYREYYALLLLGLSLNTALAALQSSEPYIGL